MLFILCVCVDLFNMNLICFFLFVTEDPKSKNKLYKIYSLIYIINCDVYFLTCRFVFSILIIYQLLVFFCNIFYYELIK